MNLGDGNPHQFIELLRDLWSIHANFEKRLEFFGRMDANLNSILNQQTTVSNIHCEASTKDGTKYPKTAILNHKSMLFNQVHWSVMSLTQKYAPHNIESKQWHRSSNINR